MKVSQASVFVIALLVAAATASCADPGPLTESPSEVTTPSVSTERACAAMPSLSPDDPLIRDAQSLADDLGVPLEQAVCYLRLQDDIGRLGAYLRREGPASFGGLYIAYDPSYRVVVLSTTGDRDEIVVAAATAGGFENLTDLLEVHQTQLTEQVLSRAQQALIDLAPDMRFESGAQIHTGTVYVRVETEEDAATLRARLQDAIARGDIKVPFEVFVIEVGELGQNESL